MKQISNNNVTLKSNIKWKDSRNRTASLSKIGSSSPLVKEEMKEIRTNIKIKNNISSKSKKSNFNIFKIIFIFKR